MDNLLSGIFPKILISGDYNAFDEGFNACGVYACSGLYKSETFRIPWYIGSAIDLYDRIEYRHNPQLRRNEHEHNDPLQKCWNKHGEISFVWWLLETCLPEERIIREQYYFDLYRPFVDEFGGFNVAKIAGKPPSMIGEMNPFYGKHHTDEAKKKMSIAKKGKKKTEKQLENWIKVCPRGETHYNFGKPMSEEQKIKISKANKGHKVSEETKKKISVATKGDKNPFFGKSHPIEIKNQIIEKIAKPFKLISPEGVIIEGKNISKFARENNLNLCSLCNLIKKRIYSHKGWTVFLSEEEKRELEKQKEEGKQRRSLVAQRPYKLLSPDGIIYEGANVTKFCQDNHFHYGKILQILNGKRKQYKGWTLPKENLDENQIPE